MGNIMSMASLQNKPSRNGFDLSRKNAFTAKVGELLPVMTQEVIPGDKFKISAEWFTRTRPIQTSAFTRIREYYDFYFVPARLLWRFADNFYTQMPISQSATKGDFDKNPAQSSYLPYFTSGDLQTYFKGISKPEGKNHFDYNEFQFKRINQTWKLLDYLDYGNILRASMFNDPQGKDFTSMYHYGDDHDGDDALGIHRNDYLQFSYNVLPLAAYQKIYSDYYRFEQWEQTNPTYYNFDFIPSTNSMLLSKIPIDSYIKQAKNGSTLFDLRYCNWHKDLFHGLLPSAQYGEVSSVSTIGNVAKDGTVPMYLLNPKEFDTARNAENVVIYESKKGNSPFNFSILALRQAEFLQRWKEISNSGNQNYKDQMKKHWNVDISNARSSRCDYVGGFVGNLSISEVVNTNLSGGGTAEIAGKAIGTGNGYVDFEAKEHGIFMCIYHAVPLLDYESFGTSPLNFKLKPTDFAIPEMDKIGMQLVPPEWLINDTLAIKSNEHQGIDYLGYAPRYIDYKTAVDKVHGDFSYTTKDWVAPLTREYLQGLFAGQQNIIWNYAAMKCNPSVLDSIFAVKVNSYVSTDQLLCNVAFDFKAVRNLDVNGLPY